jgi:ketopantoate reductase
MVLSLQNGLGNDEVIKEFVSTDRIIIGSVQAVSAKVWGVLLAMIIALMIITQSILFLV